MNSNLANAIAILESDEQKLKEFEERLAPQSIRKQPLARSKDWFKVLLLAGMRMQERKWEGRREGKQSSRPATSAFVGGIATNEISAVLVEAEAEEAAQKSTASASLLGRLK